MAVLGKGRKRMEGGMDAGGRGEGTGGQEEEERRQALRKQI